MNTRQAPTFGDYRDETSAVRGIILGTLAGVVLWSLIFGMLILVGAL